MEMINRNLTSAYSEKKRILYGRRNYSDDGKKRKLITKRAVKPLSLDMGI